MANNALVKTETRTGRRLGLAWYWYKELRPVPRVAIPLGLAIACIGGGWTVLNEGEYAVALALVGLFLLFGIQAVRETAWSRVAKWIVSFAFAGIAIYSGAVILKKAEGKPWSNLLERTSSPKDETPSLEQRANFQMVAADLFSEELSVKATVIVENIGAQRTVGNGKIEVHIDAIPQLMFEEEEKLFALRPDAPHKAVLIGDNVFGPGQTTRIDVESDSFLLPEQWQEIMERKRIIYVTMRAWFGDKDGRLYSESCKSYRAPDFKRSWFCFGHNNILKEDNPKTSRILFSY